MNETAITALGFTSTDAALQTKIQKDGKELEIVGVVKNYHHAGLQQAIDPIIFFPKNSSAYFSVRLATNNLKADIEKLQGLYKNSFVGNPFEYFFADENFNKQYITEGQYERLFTTASIWAIFIACLGLFGLTTFTIESRTKEIGIRKVMGASVFNITQMLSKDFLHLVLIAIIIASPIAGLVMHKWLQDFAYRINISWWVFVVTAVIALAIALLTVSFQTIKAAIANPVKSLRTD
jgi:putative ABC transport system permease protein